MTVTRRSLLLASTAAPAAGALLSTPTARAAEARRGGRCRIRPQHGSAARRLALRPGEPGRHHRPHRCLRRCRRARLRRLGLARGRGAARLEHRVRPDHRARHHQRHRLLPRRPRLVPPRLHPAARPCGQAHIGGVRRRLHGLLRLLQRQGGRPPPLRLHRLRLRPHRPGAHRRQHRERARGQGAEPAAQQPLVLGQRHLPRGPPRRHRAGARGALGYVRHDAGDHRGAGRRPGPDLGAERLRRRHGRRGRLADRRPRRPHGRPHVLHGPRHRQGDRDTRTHRSRTEVVGLRDPAPQLHPDDRTARRRQNHRHLPHHLRLPHLPLRPRRGLPPQRRPQQDQGRRPPPRPGRPRRRRQHRRDPAADDHHEVDGRQRLPHLPQPALAAR